MSSNFYSVGLNHVGAYQVSGVPFVTGSTDTLVSTNDDLRFQFPNVTKSITFKNNDGSHNVNIHFAPWADGAYGYTNGAEPDNYIVVHSSHTVKLDVKCKEVFISSTTNNQTLDFQIVAELTNIPSDRMFSLDGLEGVTE
jgi:hypothetical protein